MLALIDKAIKQDPEFERQMDYWVNKRKRHPQAWWLMKRLDEVLGPAFIQGYIRAQRQLNEQTAVVNEVSEG